MAELHEHYLNFLRERERENPYYSIGAVHDRLATKSTLLVQVWKTCCQSCYQLSVAIAIPIACVLGEGGTCIGHRYSSLVSAINKKAAFETQLIMAAKKDEECKVKHFWGQVFSAIFFFFSCFNFIIWLPFISTLHPLSSMESAICRVLLDNKVTFAFFVTARGCSLFLFTLFAFPFLVLSCVLTVS